MTGIKLAGDSAAMEFSGYASVFNNIDSYGDMIAPGAFADFLDDVKAGRQEWPSMLMQHGGWGIGSDDMTPIGVWTDLLEDESGLSAAGKMAETPRGTETYTLMKMTPRPAISGLSIGYYAREFEYGGKNDAFDRLLKKIDLVEISVVTFPANGKARIGSVKSVVDMTEREFERILRDVGFSQREAKTVISRGFKAIKADGDAGSDELNELRLLIDRNINTLKQIG